MEQKINDEMLEQARPYLEDPERIRNLVRSDIRENWDEEHEFHRKIGYDAMCLAASVQIMKKLSAGNPINEDTLHIEGLPGLSGMQGYKAFCLVYTYHPRGDEFKKFHDQRRSVGH